MNKKPICAIDGCNKPALMLFAGQLVCGECVVAYDKKMKENQFNKMQEVMSDANNNLS